MAKQISTLVEDIYGVIDGKVRVSDEAITELSGRISQTLSTALRPREGPPELRMSNLGTPCERKLWYTINKPEYSEGFPPATKFKFLFGHLLEELTLWLAEQAGHDVQGRQDECEISGVMGHRDAVVDGHLVDVKSASTFSYKKFQANDLVGNDPFGYLTQLGGYLHAAKGDPKVKEKNGASFLVIDKTLGNICLDTYKFPDYNYNRMVEQKREILNSPFPPPRGYSDVPDGKSGNRKLSVACQYCAFRSKCWPGLRTFIYSTGPVFLTTVVRLPNVPEVNIQEVEVLVAGQDT